MRPLIHPALDDITLEGILHALSDPVRAAIYATIVESGCPQTCSDFLRVSERNIPKSTLSQHFHALRHTFAHAMEEAGAKVSEIQSRLGHSSLATTGRYLAQLASEKNPYAGIVESFFRDE